MNGRVAARVATDVVRPRGYRLADALASRRRVAAVGAADDLRGPREVR